MSKRETLVNQLERKIGWITFPGLIRWIAILQLLAWGLSLVDIGLIDWLTFSPERLFSGEVWRAFSWVLIPRNPGATNFAILFIIFALIIAIVFSNGLESAWGEFRTSLYTLGMIVCPAFAGIALYALFGYPILSPYLTEVYYTGLLFGFAYLYPNQQLMIFGIIPVKVKWIAWVSAFFLIVTTLASGSSVFLASFYLISLAPFLIVFLPSYADGKAQEARAAKRSRRFSTAAAPPGEHEAFHVCSNCGATDVTHPERDFRVLPNGEEICSVCLERQREKEKASL